MNRRTLLSATLGAGAAGLTALTTRLTAGDDDVKEPPDHHYLSECAELSAKCQIQCASCFNHCAELAVAGQKRHDHTMRQCADCADICGTTAQIAARRGPQTTTMCEACANACTQCAAACRAFPEDRHMQVCRDACLACAKACRDMIEAARGGVEELKD